MEIPDLVKQQLGDEEIRAGVSLGEEDTVCLTPTRALVYRGEGLLSDESVEVFPLDADRLEVSEGRRKTTFTFTDINGSDSFSAPRTHADRVLESLLEGILRAEGVIEDGESVRGVYRFSELTLIVSDGRLVKLIGSAVWAEEFEVFSFADATGLDFEDGSVATQIVLGVDGRQQRIKAPNDEAPKLRQTIQQALFDFYNVDTIGELNETVRPAEPEPNEETSVSTTSEDLTLDSGIDPLVGGSPPADSGDAIDEAESWGDSPSEEITVDETDINTETSDPPAAGDAVEAQLDSLTAAVERQNELLEQHQRAIEQLIEELRQGR